VSVVDRIDPTHRALLVVVAFVLVGTVVAMVLLWPSADRLPEADEPPEQLVTAEVVDVVEFSEDPDPNLGISGAMADVTVELLEGPDAGDRVTIEVSLDGYPAFSGGDRVELAPTTGPDGDRQYFITDFQRLPTLGLLLAIFVAAVLLIGRWHGLRSLVGLGLSLGIVVQFIVPAILAGQSPPLVALVGSLAIMIATLYLTHGLNEMTTSAVIGTSLALVLTIVFALVFISQGKVTGFASDQAALARFAVEGLDLQGLVLAGLIIAALGVLDDVTISQASTVFALHDTDRRLPWATLFARAMKVGRDHIASVVNTLFLVYAGASLALLVLFSTGGLPLTEILNSEIVAEEVIKIVVGSLGLIAAVPITTALAAAVAVRRPDDAPPLGGAHFHSHGPVAAGAARGAAAAPGPATGGRASAGVTPSRSAGPPADPAGAPGDEDLDAEERAERAWMRYLQEGPAAGEPSDEGASGDDDGSVGR
jgi:uncharacterized membrane protein